MSPVNRAGVRSRLVRAGFTDTDRAEPLLRRLGDQAEALLPMLGRTADPDLALAGLLRLAEATDEPATMLAETADDEGTAMRLLAVLGASTALTDHLVRHPDHWRELADPTLGSTRAPAFAVRARLLHAVGADPDAEAPVASLGHDAAVDALRVEYRRLLLRLTARDLAHGQGVDDTAA